MTSALGKVALRDYKGFCQRVAQAYSAAPLFDRAAVPSFRALVHSIEKMYKRVTARTRVVFVAGQPYSSAAQMRREVEQTGVLAISTDFNAHPLFTAEQNLKFRTIHAVLTHLIGKGHPEFGQRGEIRAYNLHRALAPVAAWPALFTEVVGQICFESTTGAFPAQKVAILRGFDFVNVGLIDGCRVERKRLRCDAAGDTT